MVYKEPARCPWSTTDPLYIKYHDEEWGVPVHHDKKLFEFIMLEGAQAGLSWITVLKKRENYRKAFDGFNPEKVALYDTKKEDEEEELDEEDEEEDSEDFDDEEFDDDSDFDE